MRKFIISITIIIGVVIAITIFITSRDQSIDASLPAFTERPLPHNSGQPVIKVTYTGTAGALLQIDDHAIMLDPYFTKQGFSFSGLTSPPEANKHFIDTLLPDISAVSGILIGHAHIDHLLDAPYVLSKAPTRAKIYGNTTASNLIASQVEAKRRVSLNPVMATPQRPGRWITLPDPHIRIMAIQSEHAPQLGPILLGGGTVEEERFPLPPSLDWKAGQPLTFLVDFLKEPVDSNTQNPEILYRVFLQSSASNPTIGHPSTEVLMEHPVNLALLCVASFKNVDNYPRHVIEAVKPENIMLIHWDNIFKSRLEHGVERLPNLDIAEFIRRARSALNDQGEVLMPMPGVEFALPVPQQ